MPGHKIWPAGHCLLQSVLFVPGPIRNHGVIYFYSPAHQRCRGGGVRVLLLRDARRLARTFDAQLADLRLLMILTLGFQTILPAQIALMSARGVNTPLGWYIVIAQMAGVLLAFMLVGGLVAALRSLLGEERCRAWRGDMALFNGIVTLCVTGFLLYHMVSAYPRIFAALH